VHGEIKHGLLVVLTATAVCKRKSDALRMQRGRNSPEQPFNIVILAYIKIDDRLNPKPAINER